MGFTQYWDLKHRVMKGGFDKIVEDVKRIEAFLLEKKDLKLFDLNGDEEGIVYTEDFFGFNGDASKGEDHETFAFEVGHKGFHFCKTARKPYDLAVCLCLLTIKFHLKETKISSDGEKEFIPIFSLYNEIFPERELSFKFYRDHLIFA
jgi:hypothetical protein